MLDAALEGADDAGMLLAGIDERTLLTAVELVVPPITP